jgi:hypothetical protein
MHFKMLRLMMAVCSSTNVRDQLVRQQQGSQMLKLPQPKINLVITPKVRINFKEYLNLTIQSPNIN